MARESLLSITLLVEYDKPKPSQKVIDALNDAAEEIIMKIGGLNVADEIEIEIIGRRREKNDRRTE